MPSNYQPNIPTGTVNLNQDYSNIQGNFQQLDTTFGIDHFAFSDTTSNNGYHTVVHLSKQSATPSPVATSGEIYSKIATQIISDTALFYQTGTGINVQMTMNVAPIAAARGLTFLPGGMLMQWGTITITSTHQTGTVTYATGGVAMPTGTLQVFFSLNANSSTVTSQSNTISVVSSTNTEFTYLYNGNGPGSYPSFNWLAIGN